MKSFKGQIRTSQDDWTDNQVRLATWDEANAYIRDLMYRWTQVTETRVIESDDPVNYAWKNGELVSAPSEHQCVL